MNYFNEIENKKKNTEQTNVCVYSFLRPTNTQLIGRFINFLTKKGKKSKAEYIFYESLKILSKISQNKDEKSNFSKESMEKNFLRKAENIFQHAIFNIQPFIEVKKVRVAGTTYQVPALIPQKRQENIAMNWLLESARERKKKNPSQNFEDSLAMEIHESFLKQGQARQKRNELHKLAETNRAFSHFRWW